MCYPAVVFIGILLLQIYKILWFETVCVMIDLKKFTAFCTVQTTTINKDKYYKLIPFKNMMKNRFFKYFVPEQALNYDENMVKYFGHL